MKKMQLAESKIMLADSTIVLLDSTTYELKYKSALLYKYHTWQDMKTGEATYDNVGYEKRSVILKEDGQLQYVQELESLDNEKSSKLIFNIESSNQNYHLSHLEYHRCGAKVVEIRGGKLFSILRGEDLSPKQIRMLLADVHSLVAKKKERIESKNEKSRKS
jgi:hypothetical protein